MNHLSFTLRCRVDDTFRSIISGTSYRARFTFKAFKFLRATEAVYIQCKVLICPASDSNSRRRGCSRRVARQLESKHNSHTLVVGPIKLKGQSASEYKNWNRTWRTSWRKSMIPRPYYKLFILFCRLWGKGGAWKAEQGLTWSFDLL